MKSTLLLLLLRAHSMLASVAATPPPLRCAKAASRMDWDCL